MGEPAWCSPLILIIVQTYSLCILALYVAAKIHFFSFRKDLLPLFLDFSDFNSSKFRFEREKNRSVYFCGINESKTKKGVKNERVYADFSE